MAWLPVAMLDLSIFGTVKMAAMAHRSANTPRGSGGVKPPAPNAPRGTPPRPSKRPRDQLFHDLVGAAIDALHPGIGPHFGDVVFLHVAIAAMQLQTFIQHLALRIGQPI